MYQDLGLLGRTVLRREANRARRRAAKLRTLHNIGTVIVSSADVDQVLTRVVEAAVYITNAEEGSLLLLDADTDELYLRAQKGLGAKYANGYTLCVEDSIAGEVVQSGLPQRLVSKDRTLKVMTGYIVNSIVYVPVCGPHGTIGALSVDNQVVDAPFTEDDEEFLTILAGYAALALENARRIEELEQRSAAAAGQQDAQLSMLVPDNAVGSVSLVLRPERLPLSFAAPLSDRLLDVVHPYLGAVTDIQHCIDELEAKSASRVRIVSITHDSPVVATVEGVWDAAAVICETVAPQRHYLDEMASRLLLAEKEVMAERARIEVMEARARVAANTNGDEWSTAGVADQIAHLQHLQRDSESLARQIQRFKIGLACDMIAWLDPHLPIAETIHYVVRLLPALDQLLSSPLELWTPQQQESVQPVEEAQSALMQ